MRDEGSSEHSQNENSGVGVTFELPSSSQIYIEAKYHWINTKETTQYLPIVIGYRW